MTTPAAVSDTIATLLILVAAVSAIHLFAGCLDRRGPGRDADILHILMGIAMAGMFAPALAFGPPLAWLAVFTASAGWFTIRAVRAGGTSAGSSAQPVPLAIESAAMAYMIIPATTAAAGPGQMLMPGASAGPNPALTLILALLLLGYLLLTTDRLAARTRTSPDGKLTVGCQISMSIAMGYMLITML